MKALLPILSLLILFGESLNAQTQRIVLVEHFTNTECGICSFKNPKLHETLSAYEGRVHHISYHPPYPYEDCVFYLANKTGNQIRANYYSVPASPRAYIDGVKTSGSDLVTEAALDAALAVGSNIELIVEEDMENNTATIKLRNTSEDAPDSLKLFVALVEASIAYNSPNGEKDHYNVFRQFINTDGAAGQSIGTPAKDEQLSFDYTFDLNSEWVKEEMYVLVIVQ
ncbi:MAG: Omp28-related outer membrane protein, partial [Bacteroidota bacterium]